MQTIRLLEKSVSAHQL